MEMPEGWNRLNRKYHDLFYPEDGDDFPEELDSLLLMKEMAEALEMVSEIGGRNEDEAFKTIDKAIKKFKEWK